MSILSEVNTILDQAAELLKQLEPHQQVFMIAGLVESLDEPVDTEDHFVRSVRDALDERLELGCW